MPMKRGKTDTIIGNNIKVLMAEGRPQKQAVAMALSKAGKSNKKKRRKTIAG